MIADHKTTSLATDYWPRLVIASGILLILTAIAIVVSSREATSLQIPRLSPARVTYRNAGSGQPQVVVLLLSNRTRFHVENLQVTPSCGCVVHDFGVIELPPGRAHISKLTVRNSSNDTRSSNVLVTYQLNGIRISELVEVAPNPQDY